MGETERSPTRSCGSTTDGVGKLQALVYAFYDAWWVLPAAGFVVGFATNYLALLFIFKPIEPTKVL